VKIGALPGKDFSVAGGDVATEGKGAPSNRVTGVTRVTQNTN